MRRYLAQPLAMLAGVLALLLASFFSTAPAWAQQQRYDDEGYVRPRAPSRVTVTPNRRLVRECEGWLAVEHRVAGTVVTPQQRCFWTYR